MDDQLCFLCGPNTERGKHRLHSLPSHDPVREKWITFIRTHFGGFWTAGEETAVKICSLHFRKCDFIKGHVNHILKSDSAPSIVVGEQALTYEETVPQIEEVLTTAEETAYDPANVELVKIATGTVHAFHFNQQIEFVHIMVERASEVQMSSLHSVEGLDNFLKTDKKKFLPKMIEKYEACILKASQQPRPLTRRDHLQLKRWRRELGVLREKLFRWALEAIEEDVTISSLATRKQQLTEFERAQFLIFKSTERLHVNKDAKIRDLDSKLKSTRVEINKLKLNAQVEMGKNVDSTAQELIDSLELMVQEAQRKEKEAAAEVKQLLQSLKQNSDVMREIRKVNSQLSRKEKQQQKELALRDSSIKDLRNQVDNFENKFKVAFRRNCQLVAKNSSLTKKLEERGDQLIVNMAPPVVELDYQNIPSTVRSNGCLRAGVKRRRLVKDDALVLVPGVSDAQSSDEGDEGPVQNGF